VIKSRVRWAGHVAVGDMRKEYNILVRMSERKRSLSRPKHRQEDNTEIDLRERG